MAKAVHHVTVVSTDSRLRAFLGGVLGLREHASVRVPLGMAGPLLEGRKGIVAVSTLFGDAASGLVEIVEIEGVPVEEATAPPPAVSLAVIVEDLEAVRRHAEGAGIVSSNGPSELVFEGHRLLVDLWTFHAVAVQVTQVLGDR